MPVYFISYQAYHNFESSTTIAQFYFLLAIPEQDTLCLFATVPLWTVEF